MRSGATRAGEAVLSDEGRDAELRQQHLTTVPLLSRAEVEQLHDAYWELVPPGGSGICLDYLRSDRQLVGRLDALAREALEERLLEVFRHHRPAYFSFVLKHPGEGSALFLHRDLAVDDERFHRTFAVWMPLVDTSPVLDNGPLAFVRGSDEIRHGGFGPNATVLFDPYSAHLRRMLEPIAVPAGTALVYDARLLHASEPNRTPRPRLALGCLLAHRDRGPIQVVATGRRHRVVHRVDTQFFVSTAPGQVAADRLTAEYPVIDEYDEDPGITAEAVLGPELARGCPTRDLVVPDDLRELIGRHTPLAATPSTWRPAHTRDLTLDASRLPTASNETPGIRTLEEPVGTLQCPPSGYELPAVLADAVRALTDQPRLDTWLIVVGAGGRVEVNVSEPADLTVIECTPVRSGIGSPGQAMELDLGLRIHLDPGRPIVMWNDAPGDTIVLLRRHRRPAVGRLASALSKLRRRASGPTNENDAT